MGATKAAGVSELAPLKFNPAPLRSKIVESLRLAIETGVLKPGDRLLEKDLCAQLAVSRTSLREALRALETEQILEHGTRGLYVARLTPQDAGNLYRIRATLEALVVQQFVEHADAEDIETLRRQGLELRAAYASHRVDAIVGARKKFYDCLCIGAKNLIAHEFLNRITLRTSQLRGPSLSRRERQEQSMHEINDLISAIESRDASAAMRAARKHIENAAISALGVADTTSPDD